ncbi:pectinacetylesterase domain containing protein [Musa troglodytarum]|uniref:Pectin acetylesterase n=1 Tax=Musa troglodytarum TaxID=320322 RepID=A0A9E7GMD3_9LILI|nr:pectinacetylesterase domain containing protein [Musa troglodytarum]
MVGVKSGTWVCPLICLLYLLAFLQVEGDNVPMTLLKSAVAEGAVCLDGSPPAYHLSPGSGSGANNWLVFVEGGGWCSTVEDCVERKSNFRGSSKHMPPLSFSGMLGGVQKSNPDFYNWNRVKIRYCDGASFTGDIETVDPATDLHFRGARVWRAIMKDLLAKGMNKAENALLGGCSAGGLTTILHCDSFRSLLPASAKVKCFSDAGYFIDAKDISGADSIQSFYGDVVKLHASANNLPSSCTSRLPASKVGKRGGHNADTPFILNAAYDQWQIRNILVPTSADRNNTWGDCKLDIKKCSQDQLQTLQGFRTTFLNALPGAGSSSTGLFILSCHAHCQSGDADTWFAADSPRIDNTPIGKAVGDWYFDRSSAVRKIDCPYPCNTSCRRVATDSMED